MVDKWVVDIKPAFSCRGNTNTHVALVFQTKLMEFVRVLTGYDRKMWRVLRGLLDAMMIYWHVC